MRSSKIVTIQLVIVLISFHADYAICAMKNEFTLERLVCTFPKPNKVVDSFQCNIKNIDRYRNVRFYLGFNFTRPVKDLWVHSVLYHKFNGLVYHKFPIDMWENFCEWISGRLAGKPTMAHILSWTFGRVIKYSNFNHSCPFAGNHFFDAKNISSDIFVVEPLLPSGRFRLDMYFTETDRVPFSEGHIYFSVSDYRLEKV